MLTSDGISETASCATETDAYGHIFGSDSAVCSNVTIIPVAIAIACESGAP